MSAPRDILKIGLAVWKGQRLLLLKKRGGHHYILPGGKPEAQETDSDTLQRELGEELGCPLKEDSLQYLGTFTDAAADLPGVTVTVRLYAGEIVGDPNPRAEIESLAWVARGEQEEALAPSLRNQICPFLFAQRPSR